MTDAPKKLSAREAEFCRQWMVDLNIEQAMVRAGYAPNTARHKCHEMMRRPLVAAEIERLQKAAIARNERSIDQILDQMDDVYREAMGSGELSVALKSRELVGKHLGMFPSKMEVTGKDGEQLQSTVIILPSNGRN